MKNGTSLTPNEFFTSTNLSLVAVLSLWHPIEKIDKTNPGKVRFFFKQNDQLNKSIESYWEGNLRVEPLVYFNQLKAIKARLYE